MVVSLRRLKGPCLLIYDPTNQAFKPQREATEGTLGRTQREATEVAG